MRNKFAKVSDPNSFITDPGNPVKILYSPKVMPDGSIELIVSGKENIQDKIQSFLPETDISVILAKYAAGDVDVLSRDNPLYGDFTSLPSTYAEFLQLQIDREVQFNRLPLDVRNKFDNDFTKWAAQAGSESWIEKMKSVLTVENNSQRFAKEGVLDES